MLSLMGETISEMSLYPSPFYCVFLIKSTTEELNPKLYILRGLSCRENFEHIFNHCTNNCCPLLFAKAAVVVIQHWCGCANFQATFQLQYKHFGPLLVCVVSNFGEYWWIKTLCWLVGATGYYYSLHRAFTSWQTFCSFASAGKILILEPYAGHLVMIP